MHCEWTDKDTTNTFAIRFPLSLSLSFSLSLSIFVSFFFSFFIYLSFSFFALCSNENCGEMGAERRLNIVYFLFHFLLLNFAIEVARGNCVSIFMNNTQFHGKNDKANGLQNILEHKWRKIQTQTNWKRNELQNSTKAKENITSVCMFLWSHASIANGSKL